MNNGSEHRFSIEEELRFIIEPEITPYRGPLFLDRSGESAAGENVFTNGGFGLVDTGEKKLLVTCHHVLKELREERVKDPNVRMCVCLDRNFPVVFDINQLIDCDEILDIATFDIGPTVVACGGRKFYPLRRRPAPRVVKGNRLVLLGNQGIFRNGTAEGLEFGVTTYAVEVSSVDGLRYHADITKSETRRARPPMRSPASSPHGGISGSPCFLVRENQPCELVGFATGHLIVQNTDYICFTDAGCLNPDGTINKMAN